MAEIELALFLKVRKYSRWAVGIAILASFIFAQVIESSDTTWQVVIALIALAVGIPHGALDHLVTLPKSAPLKMAAFIAIYGALPVVIPLVSDKSSAALERVNSVLVNWHQGLNEELLLITLAIFVIALLLLLRKRRMSDAIDLSLLFLLAVTAPPLVAFAVYFGCWHAMRHTARLTLVLPRSQKAFAEGNSWNAFLSAIWPGLPALIGTFVVAGIVIALRGGSVSDQFLWITLVIVWALTVPHMAVTARLDRKALS